ncbi:MAG: hypothetical protein JO112_20085 [Planctomycetes bacterium]|nr:hypothetical protein [Planctomycetota bacterium]
MTTRPKDHIVKPILDKMGRLPDPFDAVEAELIKKDAPIMPKDQDLLAYLTGYLGDPVFAKRFADCIDLIRAKNADYTQGTAQRDRIAHFREAAKDLELPMLKVWQVFVRKHWAVIQKVANGGHAESEPIDGRINDVINYMVLLGAILDDGKTK